MQDPEDGGFVAYIPGFQGATTQGDTIQEALDNAKESLEAYLPAANEDPDDVGDTGPVTMGVIEIEVREPAQAKAPHS